jgi:hypothetical protein
MARGDGKALKGRTKGGVLKMASGGNLAARDAAMGGAAVGSRAEASRSTGSTGGFGGQTSRAEAGGIGGGGSGNRLGASPRDGGFGGVARNYPDDRRVDLRGNPNTFNRTERTAAMTSPDAMKARLGPNAAQAMLDAGVSPEDARLAAESINLRATDTRSILGDPNPGQRLATANRDGSFSYAPIQRSTIVKNQTKQFYDRILPDSPLANYTGLDRGFAAAPTTPTTRSISSAPTLPSARMTSAQDMASIVPGSVSFKREKVFTPFAQTETGLNLLQKSKSPLTYEQAMELKKQFPEGSSIALAGGKPPAGTTAYPATVDGYKVDVFVPNKAGTTTSGPKLGTFNPASPSPTAPQNTQPQSNFGGQTQRAEATFTPRQKPKPEPAATKKTTPKEGDVFVKDGVRYQIRGGKAYNFNVPGGSKSGGSKMEGRFGGRDPDRTRSKRNGGVIKKSDGAASRGKTRGRYI